MELKLKNINVCNYDKQISTKCSVESDIIVPDTKPDIYRILCINAVADIDEHYIRKGKFVFSGNVNFNILYTGDTNKSKIYCIESSVPFNHQSDITGAEDDSLSIVKCIVASTDFRVKNSRKLSAAASLKIDAEAVNYAQLNALEDIEGEDKVPLICNTYATDSLITAKNLSFSVSDTISLSDGENPCEILDFTASVSSFEIKSVNNKAIIKGTVPAKIFYASSAEPTAYETEFTFTEIADLDMANSDSILHSHFNVSDISYQVTESDGDVSVDFDIKISGCIKAFESTELSLVSDIYSPDYNYSVNKINTGIKTVSNMLEGQLTIKDTLISNSEKGISKVYYMSVYPVCSDIKGDNSSVKLSGSVQTTVIYADEDKEIHSCKKDIPFDMDIAADYQGTVPDFHGMVYSSNYSYVLGGSNEIQTRIILKGLAVSEAQSQINVITEFSEDKASPIDKSNQPSITVCYPEADMSLWDYAVKYHTTAEEIAAVNSIDAAQPLEKGVPFIIPKRKR